MAYSRPWSKRHKKDMGGRPFSLSNSFAEPLSSQELIELSLKRGDSELVDMFYDHSLEYTANGGSLDLREDIAKLYGPDIQAENIITFAGGQVAIQAVATTLMDRDSHAIVFAPGYQSVQMAPRHAGGSITRIHLSPDNDWVIDPDEVEAAIQGNTKYIVINEPYNPAGRVMTAAVQSRLVEIADKHDIHFLSDEVYRLLEHDEKDRLPAMADRYRKGISVCTLSKPWGGCGITIGWLALQDEGLIEKLIDTQYFGTACPSRASEIQAMMTLRSSDQILDKNLKIIHRNMGLLDAFFDKYDDLFEWVRPNAGAICFVKFKGPLTSEELGDALAVAGISIKPAYVFDDEDIAEYRDYFRLGYGEDIMPKALDALIEFVEKHQAEWRATL